IEAVVDAQHGVVHEHLDVLAELVAVPQGAVELRKLCRGAGQDAANGRARREWLLEDAAPRSGATGELRDPEGALHRKRCGRGGSWAHGGSVSSRPSEGGPAPTPYRSVTSNRRNAPPCGSGPARRAAAGRGGARASAPGCRARPESRRP